MTMEKSIRIRETLSADKVKAGVSAIANFIAKTFDVKAHTVVIVGIHRLGVVLAHRIAAELKERFHIDLAVGVLDITLYRDDFSTAGFHPIIGETKLDFDIDGRHIVLVDDVLFTGRTTRAALGELMDFGRPKSICLTVLADRVGHREMPIAADFAGIKLETQRNETVIVHLKETDGDDKILVCEKPE